MKNIVSALQIYAHLDTIFYELDSKNFVNCAAMVVAVTMAVGNNCAFIRYKQMKETHAHKYNK